MGPAGRWAGGGGRHKAAAGFLAAGVCELGFSGRPGPGQDVGKDGLVRKNTKGTANRACLGRGERSAGVGAGRPGGLGLEFVSVCLIALGCDGLWWGVIHRSRARLTYGDGNRVRVA